MTGFFDKNSRVYWLENIFFLVCLFPFASPCPINTDVQPLAGIVAIFILARTPIFTKKELLYLLVAVISLLYINPNYDFSAVTGGVAFMLPYGILVFLACRQSLKHFNAGVFNYTVMIYFIFTCLTLLAPEQMLYFQVLIVRNVNVNTLTGPRGVSVFATEPGLLAGLLVAFLLLNDYFNRMGKLSKKRWVWNFIMITLVLLATKSGTAVLFFGIYIVFRVRWGFVRVVLFIIVALIVLYGIFPALYEQYLFFNNNRGFMILYEFLLTPQKLLLDTSLFQRVYSVAVGVYAIIMHPFGTGYNGAPYAIKKIIETTPFLANFSNLQDCLGAFGCYTNSSLTNIIAMYGVFACFFVLFVYLKSKALWREKLFSFVFVLASYSLSFSMIWLLLCLKGEGKASDNSLCRSENKCAE